MRIFFIIAAGIGLMFLMLGVLRLTAVLPMPNTYLGKEVFETETQYSDFKRAVGAEEININTIDVLSSEPPIVVSFNVRVPYGNTFPYGEKQSHLSSYITVTVMGSFVFIFGVLFTWVFWDKQEF